jgi:hypothetical protein
MQAFGEAAYVETHWALGVSRPLYPGTSRPLFVGISGIVHRISLQDYGYGALPGLKGGVLFQVWPRLFWGFTYQQPFRRSEAISFPTELAVGFAFSPRTGNWLLLAMRKEMAFPVAVSVGLEGQPVPGLSLRCGVSTQPIRLTFGGGIQAGRLNLGIATERHERLGWTPALSIDLILVRQKPKAG